MTRKAVLNPPKPSPSGPKMPHQTGTHLPHLLCRESYRLGSHFGTILGPFGDGLGMVQDSFSGHLGPPEIRQKFAYIVPLGSVGTGSLHFTLNKVASRMIPTLGLKGRWFG